MSALEKLPPPEEIRRELLATLAHAATLRKLLRLSQRAAATDQTRQQGDLTAEAAPLPGTREVRHG
jgi:hypothetical protein